MSTREFVGYVLLIALLMAVVALFERVTPSRARDERARGRVHANLALSAIVFLLNWGLSSGTAILALYFSQGKVGLSGCWSASLTLRLGASVILLDLCTYVAHWSMHKIPLLWRAHSVHHSDPFVDVTTSFRLHPLEGLWRFVWITASALLLGLPAEGIVTYRLVSLVNGLLEHANVSVGTAADRRLSSLWVTPNMHKIHHSNARIETDSNYGNILAVFDRAFGTFTRTVVASTVEYGLGERDLDAARSLGPLLRRPFQRPRPKARRPLTSVTVQPEES